MKISYLAVLAIMMTSPGYALSLKEAWAMALENDAAFLAAVEEKAAGEETKNIARAGLLPDISVSYQNAPENRQVATSQQAKSMFNRETHEVTNTRSYRSNSGSVTITQPVFNYSAWARYRAGVAESLMASEMWRGQYHALTVRLVNAYIDVAWARDNIRIAKSQQQTLRHQLEQNQKLLAGGEGTRTEVLETQARYQLATAETLDALDKLVASQSLLSAMTGKEPDEVQTLNNAQFKVTALSPAGYSEWQKLMLKNNATLAASRHGVESARYETELYKGEFMPKIELYGSHSLSESASDSTINQRYETTSVGLRMSFSLYSGGRSLASTRQAAHRYGQKKYQLSATAREAESELRKNFNLLRNAPDRLKAYEMALKAALLQLEATKKSVLAGHRMNLDVLNAEQQVFKAQYDLISNRYEYLKARVNLMNISGLTGINNIREISEYFSG